jgi:hypothetical protein
MPVVASAQWYRLAESTLSRMMTMPAWPKGTKGFQNISTRVAASA